MGIGMNSVKRLIIRGKKNCVRAIDLEYIP
jgi:hypothetical protein